MSKAKDTKCNPGLTASDGIYTLVVWAKPTVTVSPADKQSQELCAGVSGHLVEAAPRQTRHQLMFFVEIPDKPQYVP